MKYPVPLHALELLHGGRAIYAEVEPSRPEMRRWLKVTPFRDRDDQPYRYSVRSFELSAESVALELEDLETNVFHREFDDLDTAFQFLDELQEHPVHWESFRETDCPI